jgi:excisionase family DNA binding protein
MAPARQPAATNGRSANELMSVAEVIDYLRLANLPGDPRERLRTLRRRQRLPYIKKGRLFLFRRSDVDAWLETGRK